MRRVPIWTIAVIALAVLALGISSIQVFLPTETITKQVCIPAQPAECKFLADRVAPYLDLAHLSSAARDGLRGPRGLRGRDGERGPRGAHGRRGATGPVGPRGRSVEGPRGPRGQRGSRGSRGHKGLRGLKGVPGLDGITLPSNNGEVKKWCKDFAAGRDVPGVSKDQLEEICAQVPLKTDPSKDACDAVGGCWKPRF